MKEYILDTLQVLKLKTQIGERSPLGRPNPTQSLKGLISDIRGYNGGPIQGLTYPLEAVNGGLKISANDDRIFEQIVEVLETRIGERIMRQFFGTPDLIFESFSEDLVRNRLIKQIRESILVDVDIDLDLSMTEVGTILIKITWRTNGSVEARELFYEISN